MDSELERREERCVLDHGLGGLKVCVCPSIKEKGSYSGFVVIKVSVEPTRGGQSEVEGKERRRKEVYRAS